MGFLMRLVMKMALEILVVRWALQERILEMVDVA